MVRCRTASQSLLVAVLILTGCSKQDEDKHIDSELQEYVNRFIDEGTLRNARPDVSNLIAEFVNQVTINGSPYCGQSVVGNVPHIQITRSDNCWTKNSDLNKEALIFHELGHALLKRSHDDGVLPNGRQKSIMHTNYLFGVYSKYTPELRQYYLDELFNPGTPAPSWSAVKTNSKVVLSDQLEFSTGAGWDYVKSDGQVLYTGTVSSTEFSTSPYSLSITSAQQPAAGPFSYWYKVIPPNDIPVGSDLNLKVRIKVVNVLGNISIALRADAATEVASFKTTQGVIGINGTVDFSEYSVEMQYFPEQVQKIYIFLIMLPQTSGTVYFDDVVVTSKY